MQWPRFCCGSISQGRLSLLAVRRTPKLRRLRRKPVTRTYGDLGNDAAVARTVPSNSVKRHNKRWHRLYLAEIRRLLAFWYFSLHQERGRATSLSEFRTISVNSQDL